MLRFLIAYLRAKSLSVYRCVRYRNVEWPDCYPEFYPLDGGRTLLVTPWGELMEGTKDDFSYCYRQDELGFTHYDVPTEQSGWEVD